MLVLQASAHDQRLAVVYDLFALHFVPMKLSAIASALNARLENGSPDTEIAGLNGIEQAAPGELSFVSNPKYSAAARSTKASAVIISEDFPAIPTAMLRAKDPYLAFAHALELFHEPMRYAPGVHATAIVHVTARIGRGAHIGPYVVVDEGVKIGAKAVLLAHVVIYRGVKIGDNFFAHAHAVVRENCRIGNNVLLQNGVVVGADGFGFAKTHDGCWHKIPQPAPVVIEDDVEVQANSCIDRATVGETRIRRGAKIDDLVLVGHACDVGEEAILCGQVGLAGSTRVGNNCILAGQVGSAGHLEIGDGATITSQSGVPSDVPAGALYSGYPAMENKLWLKVMAALKNLPEMQKTVRRLVKEMEQS